MFSVLPLGKISQHMSVSLNINSFNQGLWFPYVDYWVRWIGLLKTFELTSLVHSKHLNINKGSQDILPVSLIGNKTLDVFGALLTLSIFNHLSSNHSKLIYSKQGLWKITISSLLKCQFRPHISSKSLHSLITVLSRQLYLFYLCYCVLAVFLQRAML